MEELKEQQNNSNVPKQLQPHVFKKGQSGNPNGRPPGRSVKERAKAMLAAMNNEEFEDFLHGLDKKTIWEMAEGKPKQDTESKVEVTTPIPVMTINVSGDNSNQANSLTVSEDKGSTGGNVGQ